MASESPLRILLTPPAVLLVPSPSRPCFSQSDLDALSVEVDTPTPKTPTGLNWQTGKGSELRSSPKVGGLVRSESLADMQLLTIKRDKEFPNEDAVAEAVERRKTLPKVGLGLSQRELDQLCYTDSEEPAGEGCTSDPDSAALEDKLLHIKRARAFLADDATTGEGTASADKLPSGFGQDELDAICRGSEGKSQRFSTGSTKCPSSDEDVDEDDEEEEDVALVKKKKVRTYLERPHVARHSGLPLGFSQRQLDYLVDHDEANQFNIPEPQSSPQGSALFTIKRSKFYNDQVSLDPLMPAPKMGTDQAELDALCVDADDDDNEEGLLAKKVEDDEEREWSPWNSPRRSNTSSPRAEHRAESPGHGGA